MNLYIDTEFNGFGGELISMALVSEDGQEFYETLAPREPINSWVSKNVMPAIGIPCLVRELFKQRLSDFLRKWPKITIIADWPEDIKHFCDQLIVGPGGMANIGPVIDMKIDRRLNSNASKIPHNALEDAKAIMLAHCGAKKE